MSNAPDSSNRAALMMPTDVRCDAMLFSATGKCLTPLNSEQQRLLRLALSPMCLDWPQPQRDHRGHLAWLYRAGQNDAAMLVAVVLDREHRLHKLRAMRAEPDGTPGQTLLYARFALPDAAPRTRLQQPVLSTVS